MIKINIKDYNIPPEPLTRSGAYRKIKKACDNEDGEVYNGHHYKSKAVLDKLKAHSLHKNVIENGDKPKCFYCESVIEHAAKLQVEHYRPKAKVDPEDTNGTQHKGYNWLGLEWSNLLLSCPNCNGKDAKGNRFPLRDHTKRAPKINPITTNPLDYNRVNCIANQSPLLDEEPLLLNPEIDEPAEFITFNNMGQIEGIEVRGKTTVSILKLDRDPLFAARQDLLNPIIDDIILAIGGFQAGKLNLDSFMFWLKSNCNKILALDDVRKPYCAWARHIINNFEDCVVQKIDVLYQDYLRNAYETSVNEGIDLIPNRFW